MFVYHFNYTATSTDSPLALTGIPYHFEICLSSSQKNRNSLAWVLPTLSMCPTSVWTHIESRPNFELASGNCESLITKIRGACALTRAEGSLYTIKLKSACREPDMSLVGLDPVPLSKIGACVFAFMGGKGENRTLLLASEMPVPTSR